MYDTESDAVGNTYFPTEIFKGFGKNKVAFIFSAWLTGRKNKLVLLSHINLLLVGWLIKRISPQTKLVLLAHGIEVWGRLHWFKKWMLKSVDVFIPVSNYTAEQLYKVHGISKTKCKVLNNCLDPYMLKKAEQDTVLMLKKKYGISPDESILLTLTRISSKERYKGYDRILEAMVGLQVKHPQLRYILAGKYDALEKAYLDDLILKYGLGDRVIMPGYVPDHEWEAHFALAALYVMPSMKEGFGIVFIEAMQYGLPVIAGNVDGSVDALLNGALGTLVNPQNTQEIENAINQILSNKLKYIPNRDLLTENFGYEGYKRKLGILLSC